MNEIGRLGEEDRLPRAPPFGEIHEVILVLAVDGRFPRGSRAHPSDAVALRKKAALFRPVNTVGRGRQRNVVPRLAAIGQVIQIVRAFVQVQPGVPHAARFPRPRPVEHRFDDRRPRAADLHVTGFAVQVQPALGNSGVSVQPARREGAHGVGGGTVFKGPASNRLRIGRPVGLQVGNRLLGEGRVVQPGFFNGPGQEADLAHVARVPQAQQHGGLLVKGLRLIDRVAGVPIPVAVDGDRLLVVDDGHLDEGFAAGGFLGITGLVGRCAAEEIAARHPFPGCPFSKNDGVETLLFIDQRQDAAGPLRGIGQIDPSHERLVGQGKGSGGCRGNTLRVGGVRRTGGQTRAGQ